MGVVSRHVQTVDTRDFACARKLLSLDAVASGVLLVGFVVLVGFEVVELPLWALAALFTRAGAVVGAPSVIVTVAAVLVTVGSGYFEVQ